MAYMEKCPNCGEYIYGGTECIRCGDDEIAELEKEREQEKEHENQENERQNE